MGITLPSWAPKDYQLQAVVMKPGIQKDTTEYLAEGGWVDGDKIRFRSGSAEKIGGWVRETASQFYTPNIKTFTGVPRALTAWTDLTLKKYLVVGSNAKVELFNSNIIYDITPSRSHLTLNNHIYTVIDQSKVTIASTAHGLVVGDHVFVTSQATPVNGISLLYDYIVTDLVDPDNFKIDSGTIASGTTNGGGGNLVIDFLISVGSIDNGSLTGWGGGTWGTSGDSGNGYGLLRKGIGGLNLTDWSFSNWGEDLIACQRGGGIYLWDAEDGPTVRLALLTNAPAETLFCMVAQPTRIVIAFGTNVFASGDFDPLIIRWTTQEALTDWEITSSNTAGEFRLPGGNTIIAAVQTRGEILVFTDTDVYSMTYIGDNDVFQFQNLGTNVSTISSHSIIDVNGTIMWMGKDAFYYYNGIVNVLPNTLNKYLFAQAGEGRINQDQKEKTYCAIIKEFNELIWLYPRYDETECGHYAKYNFLENVWDYGSIDRTVWLDRGTFEKPYAISNSGVLYAHEEGYDDDGKPLNAFIRTAWFDIGDGTDMLFVNKIIPDIKLAEGKNVEVLVETKRYPHPQSDIETKGPFFFEDGDDKISLRSRGRQMALQFETNSNGCFFEIGKMRIGIQPDGGR